jgi:non-canonical purine NTP pyrophosphatase (RdgB/HAM1 family)
MSKIILATQNENKVTEILAIAKAQNVSIDLSCLPKGMEEVEEVGITPNTNAVLKAMGYYDLLAVEETVAEDSTVTFGFPIEGFSPVTAGRFLKGFASEEEALNFILEEAKKVPVEQRFMKYIAVVAHYDGVNVDIHEGEVSMQLLDEICDLGNGFAYDKISSFNGRPLTAYTTEEKNEFSHRGNAWRSFFDTLQEITE